MTRLEELTAKFQNGAISFNEAEALLTLLIKDSIRLKAQLVTANEQIDEWQAGYHKMADNIRVQGTKPTCSHDCGDCNENGKCEL